MRNILFWIYFQMIKYFSFIFFSFVVEKEITFKDFTSFYPHLTPVFRLHHFLLNLESSIPLGREQAWS